MKRPLLRSLTWLGTALLALAPLTASAQDGRAPEAVRPALWKVADEDTTIWLFGTIHVLPEEVAWDAGPVGKALDGAQELVTEVAMDQAATSQDVIMRKSLREDGRKLRDTLPEKERLSYDRAMSSIGLAPVAFDRNDAWFAALMLTLVPLRAAGYNTEAGVDQQVASRARGNGIPNIALETIDYQIGLFDGLPEATQQNYLAEVLQAMPTAKQDIDAMVVAWKTGDAEHLAELMNEDESDATVRKVLITDRNARWAKWLKARMARPGKVFVAVGAGHLAGPGSVQDQLARAGVVSMRVQ